MLSKIMVKMVKETTVAMFVVVKVTKPDVDFLLVVVFVLLIVFTVVLMFVVDVALIILLNTVFSDIAILVALDFDLSVGQFHGHPSVG